MNLSYNSNKFANYSYNNTVQAYDYLSHLIGDEQIAGY